MADIDDVIEEAVEAEVEAAEAREDLADAQAMAAVAQASQVAVAASEAAASLANETAALAQVEAAHIVNSQKEELEWLRQHVDLTRSQLETIQQSQTQAQLERASVLESLTGMQAALQSLIPQKLMKETADPVLLNPAEGEVGQEKQNQETGPLKRTKRWI